MAQPICRLYLITPPRLDDLAEFGRTLAHALDAGDVAALQIRLKDVADDVIAAATDVILPIAAAREVAVIMNDRPDLAARLGCDGVHVGQTDASYAEARRAVGKDRMVGVTCHDSRHLAMEAAEAGADYVAFGAFFPNIVPYDLDFRTAANADNALSLMLVGVAILLPAILGYTVWVYWLFRGKVGAHAGYH